MTAKAFSYTVTVGGVDHTNEKIADLSWRKSAAKLPISGCVTGCLEVTLVTEICPDDNSAVTVTCSNGMAFPTFCIASRSVPSAGLLKLVCYDRMMFTDRNFDISAYGEDKTVSIGTVMAHIVSQCGFSGSGGLVLHGADRVAVDEIKGKTCREVLEMFSEGACGIWYCDTGNKLTFLPFGTSNTLITPDVYAAVRAGSVKGPISRIIAENSTDGEEYDTGGSTSVRGIIRTESIFASAENAAGILGNCNGFEFKAFKCPKARLTSGIEIGCGVMFGEDEYTVTNFALSFSPAGIFAELSAPELNESEYDYLNRARRDAKSAVKAGRTYKNVMVSKYEGLSLIGRDKA